MKLCLDIGNTDIYGGVSRERAPLVEFRMGNHANASPDQFGVFILQILEARGVEWKKLEAVAVASVVPEMDALVREASRRYLGIEPLLLQAGVRTGLKIRTNHPGEVGADRIANAMAAVERFPGQDRLVVDLGTATTFCAINREDEYLGGVIAAGMGLSRQALSRNTAKLPQVDIRQPEDCLGKTTVESMQSGLWYGHLGLMREVVGRLTAEAFAGRSAVVIGTGGHARHFRGEGIFTEYVPGLVLHGLSRAIELNR